MANTRFNPTNNGPLHIGHLYTALVNEYEAHRTGGRFIVRLEDNQEYWCWQLGNTAKAYSMEMRQDLEWFGLKVDEWTEQSTMERQAHEAMRALLRGGELHCERKFAFHGVNVQGSGIGYFPYAPYLTAEKVVLDFMQGVNLLIRGVDLISENSLYTYFCDVFGLQFPRMVYLPRLSLPGNAEIQPDVSKTIGGHKIKQYRQKMTAIELENKLREACLINPGGDWAIENVKANPVWAG